MKYCRVTALILENIVLSWDIEGHKLASVLQYPNSGTIYTNISAVTLYYITTRDVRNELLIVL